MTTRFSFPKLAGSCFLLAIGFAGCADVGPEDGAEPRAPEPTYGMELDAPGHTAMAEFVMRVDPKARSVKTRRLSTRPAPHPGDAKLPALQPESVDNLSIESDGVAG